VPGSPAGAGLAMWKPCKRNLQTDDLTAVGMQQCTCNLHTTLGNNCYLNCGDFDALYLCISIQIHD
jgi:hypothetical protein